MRILQRIFQRPTVMMKCPDCGEDMGTYPPPSGYSVSYKCIWCYVRVGADYGSPESPRDHRKPPFILYRSDYANMESQLDKPRKEYVVPQADGTWRSVRVVWGGIREAFEKRYGKQRVPAQA